MNNQQQPPAQKAKAPPPAQRAKEREAAPPSRAREQRRETLHAPADPEQQIAVEIEEAVVTAGRNGETHLRVEWIDVQLSANWKSVYFRVHSLPEHAIEVRVEQLTYGKNYSGTGSVQTDVMPVAPDGTPGKLIARDLTTGEVLEQGWRWYVWGDGIGFFAWLWKTVKKLFAKPAN